MMVRDAGGMSRFFSQPLIGPILRHGVLFRLLLLGCITSAFAGWFGVALVECPVPRLGGFICPGCGMTRGVLALLRGHFTQAMHYHAFSPLAVAVGLLFGVMMFVPATLRLNVAGWIEKWERQLGISALLLVALHVYWVFRLFYSPHI